MSLPLSAEAGPLPFVRRAASPAPLVLHWVFGHLRKRGSFEDYLIRCGQAAQRAGLAMHVVARSLVDPDVLSALQAHGVTVECIDDERLNASGFFAATVQRLRPRLVHCHFGSPSTSLAAIAKLLGVRHFVFTDHGSRSALDGPSRPLSPRRLRRRLLARFIDLYLPVSQFVGDQVAREVAAPVGRVSRLFNGVDLNRFRPLADPREKARRRADLLGIAPGHRCVIYVGQLTTEKGVDDILALQDQVLSTHADVSFAWIGDGPLAAEVARRASPRARYLGLRNDVDRLLPAADLILAPSRWHEAFCLTVAEAAAAGVPAIASTAGGIPEVVADGETGLLVAPGDRAALGRAIDRLLGDEPRRQAMATAARRRAERLFSLDTMVDETLAHYRALGLRMRQPAP